MSSARTYLILFFVASAVFAASFALRGSNDWLAWSYGSDTNVYVDLAQNLEHHNGYRHSPGVGYPGVGVLCTNESFAHVLYILPGYPVALALFGTWMPMSAAPYALAFVCYLVLIISIWETALLLFQPRASRTVLWAGFMIWIVLQPAILLQLQAIGQDLMASALVSCAFYFFVRLLKSPQVTLNASIGLLISIVMAILTRVNLWILAALLLAGGQWIGYRRGDSRLIAAMAAALGAVVLVMFAWTWHLKSITGRYSAGTTLGYNLYQNYIFHSIPDAEYEANKREATMRFLACRQKGASADFCAIESAQAYTQETKAFVFQHPRLTARRLIRNLAVIYLGKDYFWMPRLLVLKLFGPGLENYDSPFPSLFPIMSTGARLLYYGLNVLFYFLYIALPCLGLWLYPSLVWSKGWRWESENSARVLAWMALSSIAFLLLTSLIISHARYRLPITGVSYFCLMGLYLSATARRDHA